MREKERERGTWGKRDGNDLAREVPRKRGDFYFPRRRYDDRAIGESTKEREGERESEQRKMREFPVSKRYLTRGLVPSNFEAEKKRIRM